MLLARRKSALLLHDRILTQKNAFRLVGAVSLLRTQSCASPRQVPGVGEIRTLRNISLFARGFSKSPMTGQEKDNGGNESQRNPLSYIFNLMMQDSEGDGTPIFWSIDGLEHTANSQWLFNLPEEYDDRLNKAHHIIFQIIMYFLRPHDDVDKGKQLRAVFKSAVVVPPESETARARRAIAKMTSGIYFQISSVPTTVAYRRKHKKLFDVLVKRLYPLYSDLNDLEGEIDAPQWSAFWVQAEPVLMALQLILEEKQFGLFLDPGQRFWPDALRVGREDDE